MLQSKVHVIRNSAYRPSMQASYMIGLKTTMQRNQLAAQIAARHTISFLRCHELDGASRN